MATNVINGVDMAVWVGGSAVDDATEFQIERSAKVGVYATSSTSGAYKTLKGNTGWTCSFNIALPGGDHDIGFDEGDLIDFKGVSTAGMELAGSARVERIRYGVVQDDEGPIVATVECQGDGTYTK